ncbi:unnamed protein product [Orchesella dallaii]|uniref:ATP synthase subunit d, mitochondrial n=1 Tax=Orchesella dallaii TaxID=48710 RepID=A0ABP1Q800_9HEXA
MAARRIASSAINWTALAERVPEGQKPFFLALKAKSDNYLRRVMANPEVAPKLDFAAYKAKIAVPGLVDSFQKQYEAIKVPYPADKLTPDVNAQEKQAEQDIKAFIAESQTRIQKYQAEIAKWDDILPFEDMTLEDLKDMFPERALDPLNNPTFWPHDAEEQLDYKRPDQPAH